MRRVLARAGPVVRGPARFGSYRNGRRFRLYRSNSLPRSALGRL